MPNLLLHEAFEFGDIAIVDGKDDRLKEIMQSNPAAEALLSGFEYSLGEKSISSAMIYRKRNSFEDLWTAMVDARNCVAVVSACCGWTLSIRQRHNFTIRYTDYFDFYPRWPSKDGKGTVYQSEARTLLTSDATGFMGTANPHLSVSKFSKPFVDFSLLDDLAKIWRRVHLKERGSTSARRLMRSLSMAYEACRVPQAMENDVYDHGKHISLWISAFETLAHPGTRVGLQDVMILIEKREFNHPKLKRKVGMKYRGKFISVNAAQRLYFYLYRARNSFLHGNPLTVRAFMPRCLGSGLRLLDTAALVFLAALEATLLESRKKDTNDQDGSIESILKHNSLEDSFLRALGLSGGIE